MRYLKKYKTFESVDLLIPSIDKYKPMLKLMSDLLNYHVDPNYSLDDNGHLFNQLYKILDKFYSSFGVRGLKIGDKKYSLAAEGDNELNKLKQIRKVYIGHGQDITFDPDLYFEDLKLIDWLLWKVEQGEYHIVREPGVYPGEFKWIRDEKVYDDDLFKDFKSNLVNLENFYNLAKDLDKPKYTKEDIEDMLLEYIDDRIIDRLYVYTKYSNENFDLLYYIKFDVPVKYESDHDNNIWIDDLCKKMYDTCLKRHFSCNKTSLINNLFIYDNTDTYQRVADVTLKLTQIN